MSENTAIEHTDDPELGQRWRDRHTGDHFTVLRTYRDNPINPSFLIEYEPPAPGWHSRGKSIVTLAFFKAYCERVDVECPRCEGTGDRYGRLEGSGSRRKAPAPCPGCAGRGLGPSDAAG